MEPIASAEPATETPVGNPIRPELRFHGNGSDFLGIFLTNLLLTVVTVGLYRPWAKVAVRKYIYQNTEMAGSRFVFTGVGSEMFVGYLKAIGIIFGLTLIYQGSVYAGVQLQNVGLMFLGLVVFLAGYALLIPLAIFGSLRYRLSRTQWRSIRFAYVGSQRQLVNVCFKGFFLSVITFGIYTPWFLTSLYAEIARNVRFGDLEFQFEGEGSDLFVIYLKGVLLSYVTLGIYTFWFRADMFNYFVDNIKIIEKGNRRHIRGNATGGKMFDLLFFNALLIVFTLGIGYAWAHMRTIKKQLEWVEFRQAIDLDAISQAPNLQASATSDFLIDLGDIMFG